MFLNSKDREEFSNCKVFYFGGNIGITTTRVKGFCAMIGGVSILKLAEDSVFVSRDGIVKTTKNDLAEANKKN